MVKGPLVSVVTPTWQRHDKLFGRSLPSVEAQLYPHVEHIVVSDGPDDDLYSALKARPRPGLRYAELPAHDPTARWGHWARLAGIDLAKGDIIAYLDDDNSFRPSHLLRTVDALTAKPDAGFAYSRVLMHIYSQEYEIGLDPPRYGQIDTSCIVHRKEILKQHTWQQSLPSIDWDLVERWMVAGIDWAFVPETTVDYFRS